VKEEGKMMSKNLSDLPYGMAFCADGSAFLYNRKYQPMYIKSPEGFVTPADQIAWKKAVSQIWFYDDGSKPEAVEQARFILDSFIKAGKAKASLAGRSDATHQIESGARL
jgi:hypothetical protein